MPLECQPARTRRRSLVLALIFVLAGCSTKSPTTTSPASATEPVAVHDRAIRSTAFGELEWFDAMTTSTVKLVDGTAERMGDIVTVGGYRWELAGPVVYADVDGDGDEDAAAGLHSTGGQLFAYSWYVWLWEGASPVQLRRPIASTTRCDGPIESVTAEAGGFQVRMLVAESIDTCARGGSIPVNFVVAVRDGWPVRVAPEYGPLETCNPRDLTVPVKAPGLTLLRVAPDEQAPLVTESTRFDQLFVSELTVSPYLAEVRDDWVLVLAAAGDFRRLCGWAFLPDPLG